MRRIKLSAVLVFVVAGVLVLSACGGSSKSSSSKSGSSGGNSAATSGGSSKGPIMIGGTLALTGGFSAYDLENRVASEIAVNDINASGGVLGRQLKYDVEDTESNLSVAPQVASDLLSKGAVALITQCDFDYGAPSALVAQKQQVPSFSCATSPQFGVQGIGPYAYDVSPPSNEEGAAMAEVAYNKLNARDVYVLTDTSLDYSTQDSKYFTQAYDTMGGKIVGTDTFKNTDTSVQSQITKLKSASPKPQAIVLSTYLPGGPNVVRQIRAAGINLPIISGSAMESRGAYAGIPNLTGLYLVTFGSIYGKDPRPAVNKLMTDFKQKAGKPATTPYPILAYTEIQIIADAIKKAGSTSGPAMVKALNSFNNVPTLAGPVSYTAQKHWTTLPVAYVEYKNGTEQFLGLLTPTNVPAPSF